MKICRGKVTRKSHNDRQRSERHAASFAQEGGRARVDDDGAGSAPLTRRFPPRLQLTSSPGGASPLRRTCCAAAPDFLSAH